MKIKGIKKAVGDFNRWIGCARIYFDRSDGQVWTNEYHSAGSYSNYASNDIIEIHSKGAQMASNWDKTSMKELRSMIEELESEVA